AIRHAVGDPEPDLGLALHRVFPAIGFFHSDAENADDGLAAHGGAKFLSVLPVRPRRHETAPSLAIGEKRGRKLADFFHVERTRRAAPGVWDDAGIGINLAHLGVP